MNLKDRFFQNARKPHGFLGKLMMIRMNRRHRPLYRWGLSFLDIRPGMRILDIGCGGGALASLLLKETGCESVDAIDYSEECVAATSRRTRFAGDRCTVKLGDVGALPYKDRSFDVATAFETVYFWPDLKRSLNGLYRVLKPDGTLLIACELSAPDPALCERIRGMKIYTADALVDFTEAAGFFSVRSERKNGWFCIIARKK